MVYVLLNGNSNIVNTSFWLLQLSPGIIGAFKFELNICTWFSYYLNFPHTYSIVVCDFYSGIHYYRKPMDTHKYYVENCIKILNIIFGF